METEDWGRHVNGVGGIDFMYEFTNHSQSRQLPVRVG